MSVIWLALVMVIIGISDIPPSLSPAIVALFWLHFCLSSTIPMRASVPFPLLIAANGIGMTKNGSGFIR